MKLTDAERLQTADVLEEVAANIRAEVARNLVRQKKRPTKAQKKITINVWENFKRGAA